MKNNSILKISLFTIMVVIIPDILLSQAVETKFWSLNDVEQVKIHGVVVNSVTYKDQESLRIDHLPGEAGEAGRGGSETPVRIVEQVADTSRNEVRVSLGVAVGVLRVPVVDGIEEAADVVVFRLLVVAVRDDRGLLLDPVADRIVYTLKRVCQSAEATNC